jgi:hypothetical protein
MDRRERLLIYAVMALCTGAAVFVTDPSLSWTGADTSVGKCGYYTNSAGHSVPRPCGDWHSDSTRPSGATAQCRDGTWSWSEHPFAPGTCSHHGGRAR